MDALLPGDVVLQLQRLQTVIGSLEEQLMPALAIQQQDLEQVTPLEQAEFHLAVARGLAAVYTLYAKTAGISMTSFQKDVERLQLYKKKVAKVSYDSELASAKRTLQLDVATANRFINAAITDLPPKQREALRQAPSGKRRKAGDLVPLPAPEPTAAELADAVIDDVLGAQ